MPRSLSIALLLSIVSLIGCHSAQWHSEIYDHASFDDVFDIAYFAIDDSFEVARSDPDDGVIESAWNYDSFAPRTRMPARERVLANVIAVDEGVQLKVRVQRQIRDERVGYGAFDDDLADDWEDTEDNFDRAAVMFQKIRSALVTGGPSSGFMQRDA